MAKAHTGACRFEQAKRGNFEVCGRPDCSERFPCPSNDCGHSDCIAARGHLPKCHYCGKTVTGEKGDRWTPWAVHGKNRAVHYTCRSENASPEERARWGDSL